MTRKLLVSCPVSPDGNLHPSLVQWMFHIQGETYPGWEITVAVCRDRPVVQSRNRLVKQFLETDCDVLLTVDSDQVPQIGDDASGGLKLLLDAMDRDDVDIVNAITVRRTDNGPLPVVNRMTGDCSAELHTDILSKPKGLHELSPDGVVGGAGIMVKRHVAEKFLEEGTPWFKDVFEWRVGKKFDEISGKDLFGERYIGHDIWFFLRAHEMGFRSWIDTRVFWGHVKEGDLRDEFQREMALREKASRQDLSPIVAALARTSCEAWGNREWSAPPEFISRLAAEARKVKNGQCIVECGSGLTTTLLRQVVRGDKIVSLESDPEWAKRMGIEVSKIEDRGDYAWYDGPEPKEPVGLLVVDGPASSTKGGRSGAMPEMYDYLADNYTVMLDDVHRKEERDVMESWIERYDLTANVVTTNDVMETGERREFVVLKGSK